MPRQVAHAGGRPHTAGTVLAAEMSRRHLKMGDVAGACGISHRRLYDWLSRRADIAPHRAALLCRYMKMQPKELIDGTGFLKVQRGKKKGQT